MAPVACFTSSEGLEPPNAIYYPTGLVVSPGGTALYVSNSDFDLQYNGGTVQVIDLLALRSTLFPLADAIGAGMGAAAACPTVGLAPNDNVVLNPGPCMAIPLDSRVRKFATIGAFASGAILVHNPAGPGTGSRLLVPVRGDPSITFFDVSDDRGGSVVNPAGCSDNFCLECGAAGGDPEQRCGGTHRIGETPLESLRGLTLPVEPVGIAAAEPVQPGAGMAVVTAHQTVTAASLTVINSGDWSAKPRMEYYINTLPQGPTEVAALPIPARIKVELSSGCQGAAAVHYQPGFFLTYRAAPELDLLRFNEDACSKPPRPFISRVGAIGIDANADAIDSRGVALDAGERQACEASCEASVPPTVPQLTCLETCAAIPIGLYVANRTPASLLVGHVETEFVREEDDRITGALDLPTIFDTVPLSFGASKLAIGKVIDRDGILRTRVFAVAFDSRLVFSYDPEARRIEAVIRTGRGPHAIAFDTASDHSFMYVGHFTDSYIGVVDLDMRRPQTFGSMFATVGAPTVPRESK
jgi:hypothetical protein